MKLMLTIGGLMNCNVPEFKPQEYKGLRQNCGRKPSKEWLAKIAAEVADKGIEAAKLIRRERRSKPNRMSDIARAVDKVTK